MYGDQSNCDEAEEPPPLVPPLLMTVEPFSGVRVLDSPILLLVLFHKAIKEELDELHRFADELLDSCFSCRDRFSELRRRFEFLKLVYKYHSASEDEIIFLALDALVKNIVTTYSLEHISIDDLFDSIFHSLEVLMKEDGDAAITIQDLVSFIDTLQTIMFQHMLKEEEQVFPLLVQNFCLGEQASLVWQFMCSVPVALLQDFWPWMASFFSSDERVRAADCIKAVVPKDILLQEVIISWFDGKRQNFDAYDKYGKGALFFSGHADFQKIVEVCTSEGYCSVHISGRYNPIGGVHLWHGAFRKDLKDNLQELYEIRSSDNFSSLVSAVVQLNFITDVLIFYSNALDKIVYPIYVQCAENCEATYQQFLDESQIEGLRSLLYCKAGTVRPLGKFVEELCVKLEACLRGIDKNLTFLETEVFPCLGMYCSHEMQQWLVYTSLEMMPLGLLKCTISWFSSHLSEDESKSIMFTLMGEGSFSCKPLSPLLHEWLRSGYLGKSSIEKFRRELLDMYNHKCSLLSEEIKEDSRVSILQLDMHPSNRPTCRPADTCTVANIKNCISSSSSSGSTYIKKHATFHSSGMSFHVFFPPVLKMSRPVEENNSSSFPLLVSNPVDHIFLFHKVLKKDLEQLVLISSSLAQNGAFFVDFHRRFHLVQSLYHIHSNSEDEVAFPALEAKGKTQNISHSYSIDHKLELEHFNRISSVLDQISELHVSISSGGGGQDGRMLKYRQLCMKLHDMCKSMNRLLCDHLNHEEIELWPLFREEISIEEQEKIIGRMLGRTTAEVLEEMIPWLMGSLTPQEQYAMITLWRKATKNTMFDQWLGEWWEGMKQYDIAKVDEQSSIPPLPSASSLEDLPVYMFKEGRGDQKGNLCDKNADLSENDVKLETLYAYDKEKAFSQKLNEHHLSECCEFGSEVEKNKCKKVTEDSDHVKETGNPEHVSQAFGNQGGGLKLSQEELETSIRRVSRDSALDPQKKSFIIQNLLMSRWNDTQKISHPEVIALNNKDEVSGQCPSYRDPLKSDFGCQHYKRNCKLVAACCNKLYTCRNCHDDECDHSMDRKATTKMMCMKCLIIQPIAQTCSTASCNNFSMAKYYCKICRFFDDERKIYHCPYCNLCRVGMGLGIDFFHCMNCNACMSNSLSVHICREKCFMDNCPICHEYIFTSTSPVKALPCGHLMHSSCFQDYTCSHYTCPICSKSLGDMHAYFGMLDALLAEENKISHEYSGKTQVILCNDCEKRGSASFHWLYHKCSYCGSYNTRLL